MDHSAPNRGTIGPPLSYRREVVMVMAVARHMFPHEDAETILEILDLYSSEPSEQGRSRVQLAILKLSAGDPDKLLVYVVAARTDWRDVLAWSDSPVYDESQVASFIQRLLDFEPGLAGKQEP